jgi:hypothetical protein
LNILTCCLLVLHIALHVCFDFMNTKMPVKRMLIFYDGELMLVFWVVSLVFWNDKSWILKLWLIKHAFYFDLLVLEIKKSMHFLVFVLFNSFFGLIMWYVRIIQTCFGGLKWSFCVHLTFYGFLDFGFCRFIRWILP